MATGNDAHALEVAVRRANRPTVMRWARSPVKLARFKRMKTARLTRAQLFWGGSMLVTPPEPLSSQLYLWGFHERGTTRFVLDMVRPGMTVLDVGAHYGYYTLLAAHLVGPRGSVHSFEPVPSTVEILRRNVERAGNVSVNPVAAWSADTELEIHDFGVQRSMFNSVYGPRGWDRLGRAVKARAIRLDDYVSKRGLAPGFIKIDAESAEPHLLAGLESTLREQHPVLSLEVGDGAPDQPVSSRQMLDMLCDEFGYDAFEFAAGQLRAHERRERYHAENIALVPN